MKLITSTTNENYKRLKELGQASGIRKQGVFLVMGSDILRENLLLLTPRLVAEVRTEKLPPLAPDRPQWILSPSLFSEIDTHGTKYNLFLCEDVELPEADLQIKPKGLELIVPLGDPTNLGALARSALAFGVTRLILTAEAVHPFHPKAIKASAGAILQIPLAKTGALCKLGQKKTDAHADSQSEADFWALDLAGENLMTTKLPKNMHLLVGEEGLGLAALKGSSMKVGKLFIPTSPKVESLNATVAVSLAMYEYQRQHSTKSFR